MPILTAFEIKVVNQCLHAYNVQFLRLKFHGCQKQLKIGTFNRGVCDKATAQTAQFRAMGFVSGPSQRSKDMPFVSEFRWGAYSLGAISPRKTPQFGEISRLHFAKIINFNVPRQRATHVLMY